ncbi:unnamed protein product [Hymenolepis diminuta]|uniref:Uncharacterized protein n=1 Tax=Hymenolepis diminuta TaxID=6216 RepID=A0A564YHI1_HYMDI|nr:unnamed protein product [Hymenolepis diminuta]
MEQINLFKPDKEPEDNVKNVGKFYYEPSIGGVFSTLFVLNWDVYENRMAGLSNGTKVTLPFHKNPDAMLHNRVDEYKNFWSPIACSNVIESRKNRTYLNRRPEFDRLTEINLMLQCQTQRVYLNNNNYKPRGRLCAGFHLLRDYPFFKYQIHNCNSCKHEEGFCQSSQRRPYPS